MSKSLAVHAAERRDPQNPDVIAQRRIRVVLSASGLLVVGVMVLPILTSFTHVLDGVVGGIGVAYIVGFGEFVLAMAGAVTYCRWVDRLEDSADERERAR